MDKKIPMTSNGQYLLKKELKNFKSIQRPKVISAIIEAREHGDLKENAEYHSAREQQSFIEGKIKELEMKLSYAQVIDISKIKPTGKVIFGSTVVLLNLKNNKTTYYQIVGEDEADIKKNKISFKSPLSRELIGKMKGENIIITTPYMIMEYKILSVKYD